MAPHCLPGGLLACAWLLLTWPLAGAAASGTSVTLCCATSLLRGGFLTRLPSLNSLLSPLALHFSLRQCSVGCIGADAGTQPCAPWGPPWLPLKQHWKSQNFYSPREGEEGVWSSKCDGAASGAEGPAAPLWVIKCLQEIIQVFLSCKEILLLALSLEPWTYMTEPGQVPSATATMSATMGHMAMVKAPVGRP